MNEVLARKARVGSRVVLLLNPRRAIYGALLTLGLMAGAIGSHLTVLGVEVDGGALFALAWITLVSKGLPERVPGVQGR